MKTLELSRDELEMLSIALGEALDTGTRDVIDGPRPSMLLSRSAEAWKLLGRVDTAKDELG